MVNSLALDIIYITAGRERQSVCGSWLNGIQLTMFIPPCTDYMIHLPLRWGRSRSMVNSLALDIIYITAGREWHWFVALAEWNPCYLVYLPCPGAVWMKKIIVRKLFFSIVFHPCRLVFSQKM